MFLNEYVGMLCAPIIRSYKEGNIYCTIGKQIKTTKNTDLTLIRLGVSTEMTSPNKRNYAVHYFNWHMYKRYDSISGANYLLSGSHIEKCGCIRNDLTIDRENFMQQKPDISFCVLAGFRAEHDRPKTIFENAFALKIAKMAKEYNSTHDDVIVVCGSYAEWAYKECSKIVESWMFTRNINTIEDFIDHVRGLGETPACYDINLKFT